MTNKAAEHIKDILELTRNVAFSCGIVVILGTVVYQPESIGVHHNARLFAGIVALIGFAYVGLAVLQYELRNPVTLAKRWQRTVIWVARLLILTILSEGAFIAVARHTDWVRQQEVQKSANHVRDEHGAIQRD